jgi:anti-sigma regulatory factor (Ser/Thr protein kinase)
VAERRRDASLHVQIVVAQASPCASEADQHRTSTIGSRLSGSTHQLELPRDISAPKIARHWLVDHYAVAFDQAELDTLRLLASELVSNAVRHGRGAIKLRAELDDCRLLVEVTDDGGGFHWSPPGPNAGQTNGWGLCIVADEAARWGMDDTAAHVWFELDRPAGSHRAGKEQSL